MLNNHYDAQVMGANQSRNFMQKVYGWMAAGLGVSATTAYVVASSPTLINLFLGNVLGLIGLVVLQLGLSFYLTSRINTMSASSAVTFYLIFTAILGITLSTVLLQYTHESVFITLLVTAGMFLSMALYGYFTNSDLSSMGDFLFMGLIGLIIANIVGIFYHNANFSLITAVFGVIIFTLFTAYDVQQIKQMGSQMMLNQSDMLKVSVMGALKLYLDFVNLFIYLLRLFGQKKDN